MIIPYLVICARESPSFGPEAAATLFTSYFPLLLAGIKEEPEADVLITLFASLKVGFT